MSRRRPALPALVAAAALVLGPSACGSGDTAAAPAPAPAPVPTTGAGGATNAQACAAIRQTVTALSQKAQQQQQQQQGTDVTAIVQTYRDGAATIRRDAENADADVRQAADKMAGQFEQLADGLAAVAQGRTPQLGGIGDPAAAGQELRQACSS